MGQVIIHKRFTEQAQNRARISQVKNIVQRELYQRQQKNVPVGGFTPAPFAGTSPAHSQKSISGFFNEISPFNKSYKQLFPFGAGAVVDKALFFAPVGSLGLSARGALTSAKTAIKRATVNPYAGMTVKKAMKAFGLKTAKIAQYYYPFEYLRSRATGEKMDLFPDLGTVVSFAVQPFSAGAGLAVGGLQKGTSAVTDLAKDLFSDVPMPTPSGQMFGFEQGDTVFNFPESPQGSQMSATYSPMAPQVSIGGSMGGMDMETLALLLGIPLAVLLGYRAGKKKRKKARRKKYKGKVRIK